MLTAYAGQSEQKILSKPQLSEQTRAFAGG